MNGSVFLDTNILVYAVEVGGPDPEKSDVARKLTLQSGNVLSTQVLGEFYRATTSARRASPLTHEQASAWIAFWMQGDVRSVTPNEVRAALSIVERFKIGYYDALILASASSAGCDSVFSEDLNSGQNYDGVTVQNPFRTRQSPLFTSSQTAPTLPWRSSRRAGCRRCRRPSACRRFRP